MATEKLLKILRPLVSNRSRTDRERRTPNLVPLSAMNKATFSRNCRIMKAKMTGYIEGAYITGQLLGDD